MLRSTGFDKRLTDFFGIVEKITSQTSAEGLMKMRQLINESASSSKAEVKEEKSNESALWQHTDVDLHQLFYLLCYLKQYDLGIPLTDADKKEVEQHIGNVRKGFNMSALVDPLDCVYWLIFNNNISLGMIAATCMLSHEQYAADIFLSFLINLQSNFKQLKQYKSLVSEEGIEFPLVDYLNAYQVCETDNPPNTPAGNYVFQLNRILVKQQLSQRERFKDYPESVTYINSVLTLFNLHGHEAVREELVKESEGFLLPKGKLTQDYFRTQFKPRVTGYFGKMRHPDEMLSLLNYLTEIHDHVEALYLTSSFRCGLNLPDEQKIDDTIRELVDRLHFDLRLLQLQSDKFGSETVCYEMIRLLLIHVTILKAAFNKEVNFTFGEDYLTFTTKSFRLIRTGLVVNFTPQYTLQNEHDKPRAQLFQTYSNNICGWIEMNSHIGVESNRVEMVRFIREYYLSCLMLIKTTEERECLNANGIQSKLLSLSGGDKLVDSVYAFMFAFSDPTIKPTSDIIKKHLATIVAATKSMDVIIASVSYRFIRSFVKSVREIKLYADGTKALNQKEKKSINESYARLLGSYAIQLAISSKVVEALSPHFNPPVIDKQLDECFSLASILMSVKDVRVLPLYEKKLTAMSAKPFDVPDVVIKESCSQMFGMLSALLIAKKRSLDVAITDEELSACLHQMVELGSASKPADGDVNLVGVLKLYYSMAMRAVNNIINKESGDSDVETALLLVDIHDRIKSIREAPAAPTTIVSSVYTRQLVESTNVIKANQKLAKQIPCDVFISKLGEMIFGEFVAKINGTAEVASNKKTVVNLNYYFELAVAVMRWQSPDDVEVLTKTLNELPVAPTLQLRGDLLIEKNAVDASMAHFHTMLHVLMAATRQLHKHEFSEVAREAYRREIQLLKDRYSSSVWTGALASLLNLVQSLVGYTALAIDSSEFNDIVTATNSFLWALRNLLIRASSLNLSSCEAVPQSFYNELLQSLHGIMEANEASGLFHDFTSMLSGMLLTKLFAERSRLSQTPNSEAKLSELDMLITRFNLSRFPKYLQAYELYQKNNPLDILSTMTIDDLLTKKCTPHQMTSLVFGKNKLALLRSAGVMGSYLQLFMEVITSRQILTNAGHVFSEKETALFIAELRKFVLDIDCFYAEACYLQSLGHEVKNELIMLRIASLAVALFEYEYTSTISMSALEKTKSFDLCSVPLNEYFNQIVAHALMFIIKRRLDFLLEGKRSNREIYNLHQKELDYLVQHYDSASEVAKPVIARFTMEFLLFIRRINFSIGIVGYVHQHEKTILSRCENQALLPMYQFMHLSTFGVDYPATEDNIVAKQRTFMRSISEKGQPDFCKHFFRLSHVTSMYFMSEVNIMIGRAQVFAKDQNKIPNEYLFMLLAFINFGGISKSYMNKFTEYANAPRAISNVTLERPSATVSVTMETSQTVVELTPPPVKVSADLEFKHTAEKCRKIIDNSKLTTEARCAALLTLAEALMHRLNEATEMEFRDKMYKIVESHKSFILKHRIDSYELCVTLLEQFKPHHQALNAGKFEPLLIEEIIVETVLPQESELIEITRPNVEAVPQQEASVSEESEEEIEESEEEETQESDSVKPFDIFSANYEEIVEHCAHANGDVTFRNIYNLAKPIVFNSRYDKACRVRMMVVLAQALLHRLDEAQYHYLRERVPNIIKTNTPYFGTDCKDELLQCRKYIAEFQKATAATVVEVGRPAPKPMFPVAYRKPEPEQKPAPKPASTFKPTQLATTASINKQLLPVPDPLAPYRVRAGNRLLESFRMPPLSPVNETFVRVLGKMNITSYLYDDSVCSPLFNVAQLHMKLVCFVEAEALFKLLTSHENSEFLYLKEILPRPRQDGFLLRLDEAKLNANNEKFTRSDLLIEIKCLAVADKRLSLLHFCFEEQLNSMLFYDLKNKCMIDVAGYAKSIAVYPVTHLNPQFNVYGVLDLCKSSNIPTRDKPEVIYSAILKLSRYNLFIGCGLALRCFIGAYKHEISNRKARPFLIEQFDELFLGLNAVNAARCMLNFDALYDFFPVLLREYEQDFMAACSECLCLMQSYDDMSEQSVQRARADFLVRALYRSFMQGKNILDYLSEAGENKFAEDVTSFINKLPFEIFSEDNLVLLEKVVLQFWAKFLTTNLGGLYHDFIASRHYHHENAAQSEFCKQAAAFFEEMNVTEHEWLVQQLWSWHEAMNEQYQCHQMYNM